LISKRFGIKQGEAYRPIDDLAASLVNSCYGKSNHLDLGGTDEIAVIVRTILESVSASGWVVVTLSDGTRLEGSLHESWEQEGARRITGRTLDLQNAYTQLLVALSSPWAAVVKVHNADLGVDELYVSEVLPFGAAASVYIFSRFARSLRIMGSCLMSFIWSHFFDDYPQLTWKAEGDKALHAAERFFSLLGWCVSLKEKKRLPFGDTFDYLGVVFDFTQTTEMKVVITNKPSRLEDLEQDVDDIVKQQRFTQPEAARLRGRLSFAEGQLFGMRC
jgi:hypothetical protein